MSLPEEEYREFVGSRAASLHRTAYLLCGDWHLANDLVQETFVQTFRHCGGCSGPITRMPTSSAS
jgi:DNA-directed RNA polymerase specialized sigma24 family protein